MSAPNTDSTCRPSQGPDAGEPPHRAEGKGEPQGGAQGVIGLFSPRWTGQIRPIVDTAKAGHFRRPETGVEFYFTASCVGKDVWTLVRQLRGPHLRMWA